MRVIVTGGSGKLGRTVVADLLAHGHQVFNLDSQPPSVRQGVFLRVDLTDYGQVLDVFTGVDQTLDRADAVVHLAAIPAAGLTSNVRTATNNMTASYHVFAACQKAGIKRIVWASSETVLGVGFDADGPPAYVPIDEDVSRPRVHYAVVKTLEEELAAQFCRWDPELTMIGLRFSNVMQPDDYEAFGSWQQDGSVRLWNLWSYIDARDAAQAVRLGLTAQLTGRHIFTIANADTVMTTPTADLLATHFPDVEQRAVIAGTDSPLSIARAREVLGFDPQYSWRRGPA